MCQFNTDNDTANTRPRQTQSQKYIHETIKSTGTKMTTVRQDRSIMVHLAFEKVFTKLRKPCAFT